MSSKRKSPQDSGGKVKKEKPLKLEVGKVYESRDGSLLVEIYEEREDHRYPFYGHLLKGETALCWWRPNGRFFEGSVDQFDLVREVKPPVKAGAKGKSVPAPKTPPGAARRKKKSR